MLDPAILLRRAVPGHAGFEPNFGKDALTATLITERAAKATARSEKDGWRRFDHQLEPAALIEQFLVHPPEDFEVLDGGVSGSPAFSAPFYLLSTAAASIRQRVETLPLFSRWSRWLRPRAAFVGTTVTEYVLVRGAADVHRLPCQWKARWASRFAFLIVKDIPHDSPLLSASENRRADELATSCEAEGYFLVEGQALAYVAINFPDLRSFLQRLSPSRRKNLRRKMRSRDDLLVTELCAGDAVFDDESVIDAYFKLYLSVFVQSELQFDKVSRDFLASVLRDSRGQGVVFEYRRRGVDDSLIGWNLCFIADGRMIDKYIGLAYPAARELNLYFVSWLLNLEYACRAGLSHYVAGWTDPEVKAQLGARFTFTRHAVYSRHALIRIAGRGLSRHFASDRDRLRPWL